MEIPVFYSYSHKDEIFRKELVTHLEILRRNKMISGWSDTEIAPGSNWKEEINTNIQKAKIILLLISSDFIASDYCYETETIFALEQHEKDEAKVIPIIIRPCLWKLSKFTHLQVLPKEGKALTTWQNRDSAWLNIAEGIIKVIENLNSKEINISNNKNVILDSVIIKGNTINVGDTSTNERVIQYHKGSGDTIKGNKTTYRNQEINLSILVYDFLKEYHQWYFSPLRINKWGGRQKGYEKLSKSNSKEIKHILEKFKDEGIVKITKSKKGNPIYKIEN